MDERQIDRAAAQNDADFFECADGSLIVCPLGQTPDVEGCRYVGTGKTTLEYGDCS